MAWRRIRLPECPLCNQPLLHKGQVRTATLTCRSCHGSFVPAIGLVGRLWGDHLTKWFSLPAYLLVVAGYRVVTGAFGGYVVALLLALPLAVVSAQVVGLGLAFRWAATVRQEHIMRQWR